MDEGYSRNALCGLNQISTGFFLQREIESELVLIFELLQQSAKKLN
jgi:hypothetical protein